MRISPSSSGCSAMRACVMPWRTASSIVARIESIMSCMPTPAPRAALVAGAAACVVGNGAVKSCASAPVSTARAEPLVSVASSAPGRAPAPRVDVATARAPGRTSACAEAAMTVSPARVDVVFDEPASPGSGRVSAAPGLVVEAAAGGVCHWPAPGDPGRAVWAGRPLCLGSWKPCVCRRPPRPPAWRCPLRHPAWRCWLLPRVCKCSRRRPAWLPS